MIFNTFINYLYLPFLLKLHRNQPQLLRGATKNFLGQGRFLGVRALRSICHLQHMTKKTQEKNLEFFFHGTLKTPF